MVDGGAASLHSLEGIPSVGEVEYPTFLRVVRRRRPIIPDIRFMTVARILPLRRETADGPDIRSLGPLLLHDCSAKGPWTLGGVAMADPTALANDLSSSVLFAENATSDSARVVPVSPRYCDVATSIWQLCPTHTCFHGAARCHHAECRQAS